MVAEVNLILISASVAFITAIATEFIRVNLRRRTGVREKIFESQFTLYQNLMVSLNKLQAAADLLWEEVNEETIHIFTSQLSETEQVFNDNSLLIEKEEYDELKRLLANFNDFLRGKNKLMELWESHAGLSYINEVIENNRIIKMEYSNLMNQIRESLRRQLRTP